MSAMTWNQFKEHIDKQIKEQGLNPDGRIWYIDIIFPDNPSKDNSRNYHVPKVFEGETGLSISL